MAELKEIIRERLDSGQDISKVKSDLMNESYASGDVDKAAAVFDWKTEKKELKESGKQEKYEGQLKAAEKRLKRRRLWAIIVIVFMIIGGYMFLPIFPKSFSVVGVILFMGMLVLITAALYALSGMHTKGIH